jgi:hypothetical protein
MAYIVVLEEKQFNALAVPASSTKIWESFNQVYDAGK